jgi:chromosome segregation ATPase
MHLFEQISGSEELKAQYEELEKAKEAAEKAAALLASKRKGIAIERRHKKDQKDEAEKYLQQQEELVSRPGWSLSIDGTRVLFIVDIGRCSWGLVG